ncbi:chaperonin 10-like protein [Cadophora sp. MPI-SDFR-AT-0126]|nr:chaperonin 10-like protein [Leotiomycetes sp. MPI-SDFR-AT-0126]
MPSFTVFRGSEGRAIIQDTTTKDIGAYDVLIETTHSGVCASDENYRRKDMVLGHEGAGIIKQVGNKVTKFKICRGDRCGWGYQHSCCSQCKQCLRGTEIFCPKKTLFGFHDFDQGSFGTGAVWNEDFVFHIPDGLINAEAAPLMCAGSTVWNALQMYPVKSTDRVGIIGIGGLGHIAIQFASRMGCDVVAFSESENKHEEALRFGAREFYPTNGVERLDIGKPLDRLLVTSSAQPNWELYMGWTGLMEPHGIIYPLSISFAPLSVPYMGLLSSGLRIQGSLIASRGSHIEMLEFAARYGIKPMLEEFPLTEDGITGCMQKLKNGEMRYRAVLVAKMHVYNLMSLE